MAGGGRQPLGRDGSLVSGTTSWGPDMLAGPLHIGRRGVFFFFSFSFSFSFLTQNVSFEFSTVSNFICSYCRNQALMLSKTKGEFFLFLSVLM